MESSVRHIYSFATPLIQKPSNPLAYVNVLQG